MRVPLTAFVTASGRVLIYFKHMKRVMAEEPVSEIVHEHAHPLRPVVVKALVVCLALAVAPWLTGGQEPLAMLISGFALLLGSLLAWRQPATRRLRRGPLLLVFWLLIGFAILSLLWTANRYSTTVWIVEWVMAALSFRLAYTISGAENGKKWVVNAYLISAVIFCVIAILMYLTSQYGRLTGTFYWANPAAAYLLPAILLGVDGLRRSRIRSRKLYGWMALTVLYGASFLLTDSRATLAVLLVAVIIYLLLVKLSRPFWIHFLLAAAACVVVSFGTVALGNHLLAHSGKILPGSRIAQAVQGESTSGADRMYYLSSALDMWFTHPLGGVGAGAYGDVHPTYQQRVISASTSAHNEYVQVLSELGIFGAALLGLLILLLALGSLRGLVASPSMVPLAIGVIGLLMHIGLDIDARYPAILCLVGAFFGLMYAQSEKPWVKISLLWPAVSAVTIIPIVSLYFSGVWADRGAAAQTDGDYATAAQDYAHAASGVIYNPDYITAEGINRYTLGESGMVLAGDNRPELDTALAEARLAERQDPYDAQHHQLEGRILVAKGDLVAAEAAFRRTLALDPRNHPDYALDLASTLVREKKLGEAVRVAQAMLQQYPATVVSNRAEDDTLAPNLANLESLIGNVALSAGDLREARASADRALKLDPKNLAGRALKHQVVKLSSGT